MAITAIPGIKNNKFLAALYGFWAIGRFFCPGEKNERKFLKPIDK